jgi:hypothetical protein
VIQTAGRRWPWLPRESLMKAAWARLNSDDGPGLAVAVHLAVYLKVSPDGVPVHQAATAAPGAWLPTLATAG